LLENVHEQFWISRAAVVEIVEGFFDEADT